MTAAHDETSGSRPGSDGFEMVSAIGHELRNIVGAVIHQIELLSGDELDEPLRVRSRAAVVESAYELNRFVDALTDLERLHRGELVASRAAVELDELLDSVVDESAWGKHERGDAPGPELVHVAEVEPSEVLVDPPTIRRVLTMAIAESVARLGAVTISSTREGEYAHITFDGAEGAETGHRSVGIDDGLGLWVASQLAQLSEARLETTASGTSMRLILWLVAVDQSGDSV